METRLKDLMDEKDKMARRLQEIESQGRSDRKRLEEMCPEAFRLRTDIQKLIKKAVDLKEEKDRILPELIADQRWNLFISDPGGSVETPEVRMEREITQADISLKMARIEKISALIRDAIAEAEGKVEMAAKLEKMLTDLETKRQDRINEAVEIFRALRPVEAEIEGIISRN